MRRHGPRLVLAAALGALAVAAPPAQGELELGPVLVSGEAQVGWRGVWGDTDSAKFEEYRDIPDGAFGSLHFLFEDAERSYYLQAWLNDIASLHKD